MSSHDLSNYLSPATHLKTLQVFLIDFPKCLSLNTKKMLCSKCRILLLSSVISVQYDGENDRLLLNVAFVVEILGIISRVHHVLFITLPDS